MKKLLIFALLVGWAMLGLAQVPDTIAVHPRNVFKFLPVNLPFQTISLQYEGMVSPRSSLVLGVGFPNQQSVIGKYDITFDPDLVRAELGTTHIRTALRFYYTGKSYHPNGFYFEPYLKYQHIKGNSYIVGFADKTHKPYEGIQDLNFNTFNLGFQLGVQFMLAKFITFDLYFLGIEAGLLNGRVYSESPSATQGTLVRNKIEGAINDMNLPSFIGDRITVTQTGYRVKATADNVVYPWYRGGISIGIAF